jgi:hypothetical protein
MHFQGTLAHYGPCANLVYVKTDTKSTLDVGLRLRVQYLPNAAQKIVLNR